ncbi:hypothetical protein LUZ60_003326 [Juncus effusus]|nr:hypothetical protein LUZ60_003326 [Juncus effusus]
MEEQKIVKIPVIWRGKQLNLDINSSCNIKELGNMLQELTNVKPDTLKLLVPTNKSSKLIAPFSDSHSNLSLQDTGLTEGKMIRMMGVFEDEIEEVSENGKQPDLRIIGFEEEEKRLKQRSFAFTPQTSLKLPKGPYIFCDFRTLSLPGIQLNPPASEALKRMHMLACDPGIIAVMNKHKWRVGIMTEMAPVGYVGISPKCILGFNKNMGEEISLRLRTDDLKGFRKYESIKKTLLHELAHMVHSEHDANFFALNTQLNKEAESLDWTRSTGHTLTSRKNISSNLEEDISFEENNNIIKSNKLGGEINPLITPRDSSINAAYKRLINTCFNYHEKYEPDPDENNKNNLDNLNNNLNINEPDPDESLIEKINKEITMAEPDPDENTKPNLDKLNNNLNINEPDPDETLLEKNNDEIIMDEPDPDENKPKFDNINTTLNINEKNNEETIMDEPDPDEPVINQIMIKDEMDLVHEEQTKPSLVDEGFILRSDPEIERIDEPVLAMCSKIQESIKMLRSELTAQEASSVLQTLSKIIRNVIEHPSEAKFKKLRKANPHFQRNVANHRGAMEVLKMVGFIEDVVADEIGRVETYLVLKRNDPGLLWLAKSSLEVSLA